MLLSMGEISPLRKMLTPETSQTQQEEPVEPNTLCLGEPGEPEHIPIEIDAEIQPTDQGLHYLQPVGIFEDQGEQTNQHQEEAPQESE